MSLSRASFPSLMKGKKMKYGKKKTAKVVKKKKKNKKKSMKRGY
jgi:hypothetical protein